MWILLGILALIVMEVFLLIQLGGVLGFWLTLVWIVLTAGLGVILLKGVAMLGAANLSHRMEEFQDPRNPMAHRVLVMLAGLLLILPGPLTDTIGILLLFPPIRAVAIRLIARRFRALSFGSTSVVVEGEWKDIPSARDTDKAD